MPEQDSGSACVEQKKAAISAGVFQQYINGECIEGKGKLALDEYFWMRRLSVRP